MSPLGAVTITRSSRKPPANALTVKPGGALGRAPSGRGAQRGPLSTDSVLNGGGRSATVILRRTPGASVDQPPSAALPVSTRSVGAGVSIGSGDGAATAA